MLELQKQGGKIIVGKLQGKRYECFALLEEFGDESPIGVAK